MRPLTARRPKVMLPVAGRPLMEHLLERAVEAGFDDFLVLTHYQAGAVRSHFGNGKKWRARIRYADQGTAQGTGHALGQLKDRVRGRFALLYADSLFDVRDLERLRNAGGLAVGAKRVEDARPYGLLSVTKGALRGIEEKPTVPKPGWVNTGAYVLDRAIAARCSRLGPSPRGEFELTDAVAEAAGREKVAVVRCDSWRDAGRPWDLLALQEALMADLEPRMEGRIDPSVIVEGPVVVERGAHLRHHSVIEGPVIVQRGARVGPHAYVRPATTIGPNAHVGASVEIKNSILMESAHVPHLSYVGDSILGTNVNLGAGTNVANLKHSRNNVRVQVESGEWVNTGRRKFGAVIADDVKTGINTTINVGAVLATGAQVLAGRFVHGYVPAGALVA